MEWIKANERLWKYGIKVFVKVDGEPEGVHEHHNITWCYEPHRIEWLDESIDEYKNHAIEFLIHAVYYADGFMMSKEEAESIYNNWLAHKINQ